jgi:hypothetical protein
VTPEPLAADRMTDQPDRPPLGAWARAYAVVLVALVVEIVLMWLLTERHR